MLDERFGKEYKLCSKKIIQLIFDAKQNVKQYPFSLNFVITEVPSNKKFQIVISAPKRIFNKAHDRNRIKRVCKETFRRNKEPLEQVLTRNNIQLALFLNYTQQEEFPHALLMSKMEKLIEKLNTQLQKIINN